MTSDASGAVEMAKAGKVVVVVDVIDFSTTAEASLEAGALAVLGASPDKARPPVFIDPFAVGVRAGKLALANETEVVLVAEPRYGSKKDCLINSGLAVEGVKSTGALIKEVLPNVGSSIAELGNLNQKVILGVTGTGGVAYDAALNANAVAVLTATVARTLQKRGKEPAVVGVKRAMEIAKKYNTDIAFVAASGNSMEDILGAQYLTSLALEWCR